MGEMRGSIAFFSVYRPPLPLDLYSCSVEQPSKADELHLTDGKSYNYNGHVIPPAALKTLIKHPKLASVATQADVDLGRLTGLIFVSERDRNLETLHVALRFNTTPPHHFNTTPPHGFNTTPPHHFNTTPPHGFDTTPPHGFNTTRQVKVFSLADIFGVDWFDGIRMEDSGCIAGGYPLGDKGTADHYLIYVSTKERMQVHRSPWTVVYKTNLRTGKTERLTPEGNFDLSPSVSPAGKKVAMASFQGRGWSGEIEDLQTDIYVMNVEKSRLGPERKRLIVHGGWPTWGSENVIFFHRKENGFWGVFRYDIKSGQDPIRVTPINMNAVTPAAINETQVAVAILPADVKLLESTSISDERTKGLYRHIAIFDTNSGTSVMITENVKPRADHYNPFVIDGGKRIGYHRCNVGLLKNMDETPRNSYKLASPLNNVGLFRLSGVFPAISKDGSKLAFVDNEFKAVWLADSQGLRIVLESKDANSFWSTMWNQNPERDILYVCAGKSFSPTSTVQIKAIHNVSSDDSRYTQQLTKGEFNNAFPSSNPEGDTLVFRSTRNGGDKYYKHLYIMDAVLGEDGGEVRQLTQGECFDTHCQWSPTGDWIVFSSTHDKPKEGVPELDNGLDPGYYAIFLVNAYDPDVRVRVLASGYDIAGHVNHPVFSPDGGSIVFTADLAAVSADPVSMPLFLHSVRPYGDIFTVDIDTEDIYKNENVKQFCRITHSRYENSTPTWSMFSPADPDLHMQWDLLISRMAIMHMPVCPYLYGDGGEGWQMTGHLCVENRWC